MGVQGLLQKVKSIVQQVHLSDFEGQTLAVDGASWLHKGVLSCAAELERGEPTEAFLNYPLAMVETMQLHGVSPLVVFDGGMLPAKLSMHRQRAETRTLNRQKAANLIGTAGAERTIDAALRKAVGVTPEMARRLITELRARDIRYLVAPYEADPQLAFLVREGYAAAVVSEDSDLLPYGCARVLFKLERDSARADLIELDDLQAVEDNGAHLFDGAWDGEWSAWRDGLLQSMCVLAGTDYLASLPQVGIVKAHAAVRRHRQLRAAACELGHAQRLDPAAVQEYARRAERAQLVFRHQLVYDPATDCVRPLTPLPPGLLLPESERDELFGRMLEPALARQVCRDASLNPISRKPYGILAGLPAISLLARRLAPALCDGPITRGGPAATGSVCEPAGAAAGAAAWPGAEAGSGASGVAAAVAAPPGVAGMAAAVAGVAAAAVGATASLAAEDEFGPDAIRAAVGAAAALNAGAVNAGAVNAGAVNAGGDVEARFDVGARTGVEARAGVNASLAAGASTAVNELLAVNAAPAFHSGVVGAGVLFAGTGHAGPAKRPRVDSDQMETELLHAAGFVSVQCSGAGRAGGAVCGGGERRPGDARPSHASSSAADRLQGGAAGPAGVADRLTDSGSAPDAVHRRDGAACDAQGHDGGAAGGAAGGGGASMWWAVAEWAAATGEHPLLQVLSREGDDSLLADSTPTDAQVLRLIHASLSHWAFSQGGVSGAPAPPSLVRSTLRMLELLRAHLPQPPHDDELSPCFNRALLAGWRQALLSPLREQPPSWDQLDQLVRALPPDAAALRSEVLPLRPGGNGGAASHQPSGAACHRAVSLFSAEHPRAELVSALAQLLPLAASVLPPAGLCTADLSRLPRLAAGAAVSRPDGRAEQGERGQAAASAPERRAETEASGGAARQPLRAWRADECCVLLGANDAVRNCL